MNDKDIRDALDWTVHAVGHVFVVHLRAPHVAENAVVVYGIRG